MLRDTEQVGDGRQKPTSFGDRYTRITVSPHLMTPPRPIRSINDGAGTEQLLKRLLPGQCITVNLQTLIHERHLRSHLPQHSHKISSLSGRDQRRRCRYRCPALVCQFFTPWMARHRPEMLRRGLNGRLDCSHASISISTTFFPAATDRYPCRCFTQILYASTALARRKNGAERRG